MGMRLISVGGTGTADPGPAEPGWDASSVPRAGEGDPGFAGGRVGPMVWGGDRREKMCPGWQCPTPHGIPGTHTHPHPLAPSPRGSPAPAELGR